MLHHVIETIHQERRRLLFVVILSYVAGLLAYIHIPLFISGWPIAIFFASLQATLVGVFALCVCILTPSMRFMIEAFAVSRLAVAGFVFTFPEVGSPVLANPGLAASLVVLGGYGASRLIHGRFQKPRLSSVRSKLLSVFKRTPAQLQALPWQQRFVHWVDDTKPIVVGA